MENFKSQGILKYGTNKLIVEIDPEITRFYRSLVPKYIQFNLPKYPPHISVVRKEVPNPTNWKKYEGQIAEFYYLPQIHQSQNYLWLNAFSLQLESIRLELDLVVNSPYFTPPPGFNKTFHITIGNFKGF